MKPARILLLVVAIVAGGLAAFLATRGDAPQTQAEQVVVEAKTTMVLVATQNIGVGQRLTPELVTWQEWPESALRDEFITSAQVPDAPAQLDGTLARFEIFAGEPIYDSKLVRSDQGYLSAVLAKGKRGVSIPVSPESGAGGFIIPNDRVDVVQTRNTAAGEQSQTILENVKVLAIGKRLGERGATAGDADQQDPKSQVFQGATIATLELDPRQSETLIAAANGGQLSLVLRSVTDFSEKIDLNRRNDGSVRVIKFGAESTILPSSMQGAAPAADVVGQTAETAPVVTGPQIFTAQPANVQPDAAAPSSANGPTQLR